MIDVGSQENSLLRFQASSLAASHDVENLPRQTACRTLAERPYCMERKYFLDVSLQ